MPVYRTPAEWRQAAKKARGPSGAYKYKIDGTPTIKAHQYERAARNMEKALDTRKSLEGRFYVTFGRSRGGMTKSIAYAKKKYPGYIWEYRNDNFIVAHSAHFGRNQAMPDWERDRIKDDLNATSATSGVSSKQFTHD